VDTFPYGLTDMLGEDDDVCDDKTSNESRILNRGGRGPVYGADSVEIGTGQKFLISIESGSGIGMRSAGVTGDTAASRAEEREWKSAPRLGGAGEGVSLVKMETWNEGTVEAKPCGSAISPAAWKTSPKSNVCGAACVKGCCASISPITIPLLGRRCDWDNVWESITSNSAAGFVEATCSSSSSSRFLSRSRYFFCEVRFCSRRLSVMTRTYGLRAELCEESASAMADASKRKAK